MTQPIPRMVHGAVDYLYVLVIAVSPWLFGFADVAAAAWLAWFVAGSVAVYSFLTQYEWGVIRVIPYRFHLWADVAGGLFALAAPWLFNFSSHETARNVFLAAGAFSLLAAGLSRPTEMSAAVPAS